MSNGREDLEPRGNGQPNEPAPASEPVAPHPTTESTETPDAGTPLSERELLARARGAAGGRLEDVAGRVRQLGDDAAARNKLLKPTRHLAYKGAESIDHAADYVRTHPVDEMRSDLETTVRRHPLASLAVAFFAGYTLRRIF